MRSPRTLLTISAVLALSASAFAPTAAFAKGPGPQSGDCQADCINAGTQAGDQIGTQSRVRARDGSAQQAGTQAQAGGGGRVQARAAAGGQQARAGQQTRGRQGTVDGVQTRGRQGQPASDGQAARRGWEDGAPRGPQACEDCQFEMGTLSDDDIAGLIYMANEEKLALDVYRKFAEMYDLPAFDRIADSEARHQVAVRTMLERYGVEDPTADLEAGVFSDADLQQLYADLMAQGEVDLQGALAAAVSIELTDIDDLEQRMAGLDETAPDVHNMYSHLLTASGYHQAAFESLS
jgi:hypothetical protein